MNYPRIWQVLAWFGLNQSHTTVLGLAIILGFLTSLCFVWPKLDRESVVLVQLALISPATMLGFERANTDLLVFALLAAALIVLARPVLANGLIFVAFVLKLFPVFGLAVLLGKKPASLKRFLIWNLLLIGGYVALTWRDILLVNAATPRGISLSYGINVCWMQMNIRHASYGDDVRILSYAGAVLSLLMAGIGFLRSKGIEESQEMPYLDSFRLGAVIYVGTFFLGNNWDYRLIFLILTVPQLVAWARSGERQLVWVAVPTGVSIFVSLWFLLLGQVLLLLSGSFNLAFLVDESANWTAFAGLLYLLAVSAPAWIRNLVADIASWRRQPVTEG